MAMNKEALDDIGQVEEQAIRCIFETVRSEIKDRIRFVRLDTFYSFFYQIRSNFLNLINTLVADFRV